MLEKLHTVQQHPNIISVSIIIWDTVFVVFGNSSMSSLLNAGNIFSQLHFYSPLFSQSFFRTPVHLHPFRNSFIPHTHLWPTSPSFQSFPYILPPIHSLSYQVGLLYTWHIQITLMNTFTSSCLSCASSTALSVQRSCFNSCSFLYYPYRTYSVDLSATFQPFDAFLPWRVTRWRQTKHSDGLLGDRGSRPVCTQLC